MTDMQDEANIASPLVIGELTRETYDVVALCTTYNQVEYIDQCLSSIAGQEHDCSYLVVIHDDASTDGTSEIVKQYAFGHNDVIAIIQTENLHSRGISRDKYIDPYLNKCTYLAWCEGDDWWCDLAKIQKQYDFMTAHQECSLCVHNTAHVEDASMKTIGIAPGIRSSSYIRPEEIIEKDGGFFGSNSLFMRVDNWHRPSVFKGWGVGDYPLAIFLATVGSVYCFSEVMSCYRVAAKGSWSSRMVSEPAFAVRCREKIIAGLRAANEYCGYAYSNAFERAISEQELYIAVITGNLDLYKSEKCKLALSSKSKSYKMKKWFRLRMPALFTLFDSFRSVFN